MKIVMIAINDPAGTAISFTKAINRYTKHSCRLITTATRYNFDFEKDLHVPDFEGPEFDEVVQILREADIIHFHTLADELLPLGPLSIKDYLSGKKILHHHHGHPDFRANPEKYRDKYRRLNRKVLVSTPDLLRLIPEATWQPNLVPVKDSLYTPQPLSDDGQIRIGHSPTRKELKNTDDLVEAVEGLQRKADLPSIELDIIENCKHVDCLKRKNRCHIIFDHMQGYYGVSSLESLSQGKPVIAGLDEWNKQCILEFTNGAELPWVIARNRGELEEVLLSLIIDPALRKAIGAYSRKFMETSWSEQRVVSRLVDIYNAL